MNKKNGKTNNYRVFKLKKLPIYGNQLIKKLVNLIVSYGKKK